MSIEEKKSDAPGSSKSEKSEISELQKQIDALVRGETLPGSGSLRDLAQKPMPEKEPGKAE